jgi:hypothetical protein
MLHTEQKLQEQQLARDAHLLLQIHDELLWEVSTAQLTNVRGESSCLNPDKRSKNYEVLKTQFMA